MKNKKRIIKIICKKCKTIFEEPANINNNYIGGYCSKCGNITRGMLVYMDKKPIARK